MTARLRAPRGAFWHMRKLRRLKWTVAACSTNSWSTAGFTYVAVSFSHTGTTRARVDATGADIGDDLGRLAYRSGGVPSIGSPAADQNFIGRVAVVRVWPRALTQAELLGSYEAEAARFGFTVADTAAAPPTDAPLAWFDATPCK